MSTGLLFFILAVVDVRGFVTRCKLTKKVAVYAATRGHPHRTKRILRSQQNITKSLLFSRTLLPITARLKLPAPRTINGSNAR